MQGNILKVLSGLGLYSIYPIFAVLQSKPLVLNTINIYVNNSENKR